MTDAERINALKRYLQTEIEKPLEDRWDQGEGGRRDCLQEILGLIERMNHD